MPTGYLGAIRQHCVWCCNGVQIESRECEIATCPSHPYRLGKTPSPRPKVTPLKSIRAKCLDCSGWIPSEVKECEHVNCSLYPYRLGHNEKLKGKGTNADVLRERFSLNSGVQEPQTDMNVSNDKNTHEVM
jgi:hypothetical protein